MPDHSKPKQHEKEPLLLVSRGLEVPLGHSPHLHVQAAKSQTGGDGPWDCAQRASVLMSFLLEPRQLSGSTPPRGASPVLICVEGGFTPMDQFN